MLQIRIVRFRLSSSKYHPTQRFQQLTLVFSGVYTDSSNDAARLASTITSSLIPSLNTAIEFYIKFADGQEDPFAKGTSVPAMESLITERWQGLNTGSNLTKTAEAVFINFRSDSQASLNRVRLSRTLFDHNLLTIVYSQLTRHVNELNQQLASKEASLRELQAEYDKWSWVIVGIIPSS